jgi:alpha,alpha-trehalose phosphorylase
VEIGRTAATYTLQNGDPLKIHHHGEPVTVDTDKPQTLDIPPLTPRPAPDQPPHRRPNDPDLREG